MPAVSDGNALTKIYRDTFDLIQVDMPVLIVAAPGSGADIDSAAPLPDAAEEGQRIARLFSVSDLLKSKDATAENVFSHLPRAAIFLFAGHAISSPEQSGLLLSDTLLSGSLLSQTSLPRMQLAVSWPGTELNRRRQPFQGRLRPEPSVDSTNLSSKNLPDFDLFIGAKMEPSCENQSLPRICIDLDKRDARFS
jgi:hypothetical protein